MQQELMETYKPVYTNTIEPNGTWTVHSPPVNTTDWQLLCGSCQPFTLAPLAVSLVSHIHQQKQHDILFYRCSHTTKRRMSVSWSEHVGYRRWLLSPPDRLTPATETPLCGRRERNSHRNGTTWTCFGLQHVVALWLQATLDIREVWSRVFFAQEFTETHCSVVEQWLHLGSNSETICIPTIWRLIS